jgi:hypothetical protein
MATAAALIRMSMQDLGVLGAGEPARGEDLQDGLRRLQIMISAWAMDPLTVIQTQREEFPITPGKGTYTIGPGLDFYVERPVGQQSVVGAGLMLLNSSPPVEIPCAILTYAMYQAIQVKTLTNPLFTSVFYRPGSTARVPPSAPIPLDGVPSGEIVLWPVPTQANPLVLYIERVVPQFHDLTTDYPVPPGYISALQYNLTIAMAPMFQVEPSDFVVRAARMSLASMKRNNYQFTDAPCDPMFTMQGPGAKYDITTGTTRRG